MIDSVLVIGFGGPTAPHEIRPFLENVVRGRNVPPERLEEVAHHYEEIGGRSPYNDWTFRQADALRAVLEADGLPLPVYVGMRNWAPLLSRTIQQMNQEGRRDAAGVILAPHRSSTSWERYQLDVQRAIEHNGGVGPEIVYLTPWHTHPLFVQAMADRIRESSGRRGDWPASVPLVFTAHSIPESMASASRYAEEIGESSAAIAAELQVPRWSVAYQSASGDGRVPWLGPDVNDVIRSLREEGVEEVVLCPVGFLCDHVEVLYDLDVEARETAAEVGVRVYRAGTVGDHPQFIRMLADAVREIAQRSP
jgi:protoporphyrin/coproporphyrin ferrochelatase